ncbi:MAG: hypothetical protein ACRCWR_08265 [Saezia sp.]
MFFRTVVKTARIKLMVCCLGFAIFSAQAAENRAVEDTSRLLPEVADIVLNLKAPDPADLKQNVYMGLLAFDAPQGMDPVEIGAQVLINNFAQFEKAMQAHTETDRNFWDWPSKHYGGDGREVKVNFDISGEQYRYACRFLDVTDCVERTLAQKADILELIQREPNAMLIQRYLQIRQLPQYKAYLFTVYDSIPLYQAYTSLSSLRLAQAIFAFDEGRVDAGFALLTEEMAFAKRVLREDNQLIGKMIALVMLGDNYHTLSVLMGTAQMKPYLQDKRLLALLAPLSEQEQRAMQSALESERNSWLYTFNMLNTSTMGEGVSLRSGEVKTSSVLAQAVFAADYDRYSTINMAYKIWQPVIERAGMSMNEIANLYAQGKLDDLSVVQKKVLEEQFALAAEARKSNPQLPANLNGRVLLDMVFPSSSSWEGYLQRFYDLQTYALLVSAKHQVISQGVKASEVGAFLKQMGVAAQNPITREPFMWDAGAGTISTPWLSKVLAAGARGHGNVKDMPHNTVYLKLAY